jgi:hypothetical protein
MADAEGEGVVPAAAVLAALHESNCRVPTQASSPSLAQPATAMADVPHPRNSNGRTRQLDDQAEPAKRNREEVEDVPGGNKRRAHERPPGELKGAKSMQAKAKKTTRKKDPEDTRMVRLNGFVQAFRWKEVTEAEKVKGAVLTAELKGRLVMVSTRTFNVISSIFFCIATGTGHGSAQQLYGHFIQDGVEEKLYRRDLTGFALKADAAKAVRWVADVVAGFPDAGPPLSSD